MRPTVGFVADVRMWRPAFPDRVLLMAGQTKGYAVEPRGEYTFGTVSGAPMRSLRGRERRVVEPGQLVAWDPSRAHSGTAVDGRAWTARLMVVEVGGLQALGADEDSDPLADVTLPSPVVSDPEVIARFTELHHALEDPSSRLEADDRLAEWLRLLLTRQGVVRTRRLTRSAADDHALSLAGDFLREHATRNVGLDELAEAAGIGKYRLIRLFRARTGLAPHALLVAHRIRHARRLLESGTTIAQVAAATGFADQSHLHRHFRRSLGLTPAQYQQHLRR